MIRRLPVLLFLLVAGDYLLWRWSASGDHEVPGLVSGLALLPLALALLVATIRRVFRMVLTFFPDILALNRRPTDHRSSSRGDLVA